MLDSVATLLREHGAVIVDPVDLAGAEGISKPEFAALGCEFKDDLNAYLARLGGEHPMSLEELIEFNSVNNAAGAGQVRSGNLRPGSADRRPRGPGLEAARDEARALARGALDGALAEHGLDAVLALSGNPAWLTDYVLGDHVTVGTTSPAAVSGYPSVTVPAGFVAGLPVGRLVHGSGLE